MSILSIINYQFLPDAMPWDEEIYESMFKITERCWDFTHIQVRIICALNYSKLAKLSVINKLNKLERCADALLEASADNFMRPTAVAILGFLYKYVKHEDLETIRLPLTNIFIEASRAIRNEISSKRFLFIAFNLGFKHNSLQFNQVFEQCFPFLLLHYIENSNKCKMIYWAMSEWMGTYIQLMDKHGDEESKLALDLNKSTLLFDMYRTFFPYSYPVVDFAKLNLMKAIYRCPVLANSYSCFRNQELKMFNKLKARVKRVIEFLDYDLAELSTVSIFVNNLGSLIAGSPDLRIKPFDISFLLLNKLNEINYYVNGSREVKLKL
jgi:hypothetical protein